MSFLVIVDLDDTLVVEEAAHDAAIAEALAVVGTTYGEDLSNARRHVRPVARRHWRQAPLSDADRRYTFRATDGLWAPYAGNDMDRLRRFVRDYRLAVWSTALVESGVTRHTAAKLAPELARTFAERRPRWDRAVAGAPEALAALSPRCLIAVLTNGPGDLQRAKLARAGFAALVDAVFASGDLGVGKPMPNAYSCVLRCMGATSSAAAMIGNDPECDVRGPRAVSIAGILLQRSGDRAQWPAVVDAVLELAASGS